TCNVAEPARPAAGLRRARQCSLLLDGPRQEATERQWTKLNALWLGPGYAGIRPKISGPGEVFGDFVVQGPETHGVASLVNLYGIESPGLTASLPLADEVARKLCSLGSQTSVSLSTEA